MKPKAGGLCHNHRCGVVLKSELRQATAMASHTISSRKCTHTHVTHKHTHTHTHTHSLSLSLSLSFSLSHSLSLSLSLSVPLGTSEQCAQFSLPNFSSMYATKDVSIEPAPFLDFYAPCYNYTYRPDMVALNKNEVQRRLMEEPYVLRWPEPGCLPLLMYLKHTERAFNLTSYISSN